MEIESSHCVGGALRRREDYKACTGEKRECNSQTVCTFLTLDLRNNFSLATQTKKRKDQYLTSKFLIQLPNGGQQL